MVITCTLFKFPYYVFGLHNFRWTAYSFSL